MTWMKSSGDCASLKSNKEMFDYRLSSDNNRCLMMDSSDHYPSSLKEKYSALLKQYGDGM
jgi:hypothetical protein